MKRPSLRSVKCLPRRDRDTLLVVVICETREKGHRLCDFPHEAHSTTGEPSACLHTPSAFKHFCGNRDASHPGPARRGSCHPLDVESEAHHTFLGSVA